MIVECGACGQEYDASEVPYCPSCESGNMIYDPAELAYDDDSGDADYPYGYG